MSGSSAETGLRLREQDLTGKVALVTGASRGIGRCIALNLASRGSSILATCSSKESLHLIDSLSHSISSLYKNTLTQSPKIVAVAANLTDPTSPYTISETLTRDFGGHIDIYINNASMVESARMGELTDEHIQDYLTANLEFPVKVVNDLVKWKLFRKNSRIIMISSVRARNGWGRQSMYMATKGGAEALARGWAEAFGGKNEEFDFMAGTTANSVVVGLTETDNIKKLPEDIKTDLVDDFKKQQCLPRLAKPEDVADVVGLLCREESRWITGSAVSADGGGTQIL